MSKQDSVIRIEGLVEESLPSLLFRVKLKNNRIILAYLGGKMSLHRIKVLPGDKVIVEMPQENSERGRIIKRL
ncbi:MAG: translation initiation factor IF-1 [Minisyncoccia bacterium]